MDGHAGAVGRIARVAGRTAVALLSAAVLASAGYGWSVTGDLDERIAISEAVPTARTPPPTGASFTALLVGLDSRTDASGRPLPSDLLAQLHAGDDEGQLNTDTIILLHVPRGPQPHAVAISFPRDSYVQISGGHGTHKINSAYRRGRSETERATDRRDLLPAERERRAREAGRRTLVTTVQELAGVTIDHFAEVNLAGFVEITDALGGVPVCLNAAVREVRSGIDLPAGRQLVRGPAALAFVRQRHGLDDGDLDRIGRQQAFLAGLTNSLLSTGVLRDPARLDRTARVVSRYVVLDRGWNVQDLVGQLRRVAAGDLTFVTIPTGTPALETRGDGVAVQVDPDEVRRFVRTQILAPARPPLRPPLRQPGPMQPPGPWAVGAGPAPVSPSTTPSATPGPTATGATQRSSDRTSTTTPSPSTSSAARDPATTAITPPITADGVPCVD